MDLNKAQKRGIIKLAILLGLLCFFIFLYHQLPNYAESFVLDVEAQKIIDNRKDSLQTQLKSKKVYKYYVNSINDYKGYQLGLSPAEIDRMLDFRRAGNKIYSLEEFAKITQIEITRLDSIKHLLIFPKQKKRKNNTYRKKIIQKFDINKITAVQLQNELRLPKSLANRIINFRSSLNGFSSMDQIDEVYYISPSQIKIIKENCKLVKPVSKE